MQKILEVQRATMCSFFKEIDVSLEKKVKQEESLLMIRGTRMSLSSMTTQMSNRKTIEVSSV